MNIFSEAHRRNPYAAYARLQRESPVLRDSATGLWMLFDHDSVKRALHEHETFSSRLSPPGNQTSQWLVFTDPPRHTQLRALVMKAFTPRVVANLEPRIRALAHELLDARIESGGLELVEDFSLPLPLRVIAELFGVPAEDRPRFQDWSDVIMAQGATLQGGEAQARVQAAFSRVTAEMNAYLQDLAEQRRSVPRDDLLTRLVEAEVDGERLSADALLGFFQLLLSAGHETTTNLINNAVLCLLEHPDALARLREAPALTASAIEEVLRYRAPVQFMFRVTRRDVTMHGQVIPAGSMVLPMMGAANRDPRRFQDADRFDITRNPNPHVAFGHGIHFCIGAPLSRLEGRVALGVLLERLKDFRLASDAPWEPRQAIHVLGPTRLPLLFTPSGRAIA
ncbi:cytochrome P450 [Myxococcus sp. Y35]|uniref:cytochrome P450 n=1 Tax=Pseudomyxococcus flavus TaxID=3115648 RepID=UPI003CEA2687